MIALFIKVVLCDSGTYLMDTIILSRIVRCTYLRGCTFKPFIPAIHSLVKLKVALTFFIYIDLYMAKKHQIASKI